MNYSSRERKKKKIEKTVQGGKNAFEIIFLAYIPKAKRVGVRTWFLDVCALTLRSMNVEELRLARPTVRSSTVNCYERRGCTGLEPGLKIKDTSLKDERKKDRENASSDSRERDMRKKVHSTFQSSNKCEYQILEICINISWGKPYKKWTIELPRKLPLFVENFYFHIFLRAPVSV